MYKRFLFTLLCALVSTLTFGSSQIDSTGVENDNGKQIIIHRVEAKETYYSIGRKYQVSPNDIIQYNNNINLHPGTLLKVPTQRPYVLPAPAPSSQQPSGDKLVSYKVGPKETLYTIAKRFNTSVEAIKQLNRLTGNTLHVGQILKVEPSGTVPPNVPVIIPQDTSNSDSSAENVEISANRYGLREMKERGAAVWISDEHLDGTKMLALHRTAPVGTIVKVTNPMTQKSTFAKVVGKFTENETTRDVIIVITKAAAEVLGALDKRFLVNIVYGVPFEE